MNHRNLVLLLALFATAAAAHADSFTIEAQYRGIISKRFPSIGTATVETVQTSPGVMHLIAAGEAKHPVDATKQYQTRVDMSVSVNANTVHVISASQNCRPGSEKFSGQIKDVMPILAAVRTSRDVAAGRASTLSTPAGPVSLGCRNANGLLEVTAQRGQAFVGKFWLSHQGGALHVDRFRVPYPEENVVLNFVPRT